VSNPGIEGREDEVNHPASRSVSEDTRDRGRVIWNDRLDQFFLSCGTVTVTVLRSEVFPASSVAWRVIV
jgi:hypothetical protein